MIFQKATIQNNGKNRLKTPSSLKFNESNLHHIDIGFEESKFMVKAFYIDDSTCFYLYPPFEQIEYFVKGAIELYQQNPFVEDVRDVSVSISLKEDLLSKFEDG